MAISWTPRLLLALALSAAACMFWMGAATASGAPVASTSAAKKKCIKAKGKGVKKHARKKRARCRHTATKSTTTKPPFLKGLTKRWSDDASRANPVESGRWDLYSCQRKDGQQSSSTSVNDLVPGRFSQFSSGGPGNKPYYRFYAPPGDNQWTPGSAGRCELSYPVGDPGNAPAHTGPPGAYFFYEGRRAVTMLSLRLPSNWNVNASSWRVISQWKQNEWVDTGGTTPQLSFQQRAGDYIITSRSASGSDDIVWSHPATGDWGTGNWINLAFDMTYSANPSVGKLKVYADANGDGTYEYASSTWTGQTLFSKNGTGVESVFINGLYQGAGGDSIDKGEASIWN